MPNIEAENAKLISEKPAELEKSLQILILEF